MYEKKNKFGKTNFFKNFKLEKILENKELYFIVITFL